MKCINIRCRADIPEGEGMKGPRGGRYCNASCVEEGVQFVRARRAANPAGFRNSGAYIRNAASIRAWMWRGQSGLCGLCGEPLDLAKAQLDHDHGLPIDNPASWRAVVHPKCNVAIGVGSRKQALQIMLYLVRHSKPWLQNTEGIRGAA